MHLQDWIAKLNHELVMPMVSRLLLSTRIKIDVPRLSPQSMVTNASWAGKLSGRQTL